MRGDSAAQQQQGNQDQAFHGGLLHLEGVFAPIGRAASGRRFKIARLQIGQGRLRRFQHGSGLAKPHRIVDQELALPFRCGRDRSLVGL